MNSPMGFADKKAGIGEGNAEVFPLVLDDRACHYPQPRGGRDGMCDGTKLRALCLFLSIEEARLVETDGAARGETELALYPQSRRDATVRNPT